MQKRRDQINFFLCSQIVHKRNRRGFPKIFSVFNFSNKSLWASGNFWSHIFLKKKNIEILLNDESETYEIFIKMGVKENFRRKFRNRTWFRNVNSSNSREAVALSFNHRASGVWGLRPNRKKNQHILFMLKFLWKFHRRIFSRF